MAKSYKWTLIIRTIENVYIKTRHYYTKKDAVEDLKYYTSLAYIVSMLDYTVYATGNKSQLES